MVKILGEWRPGAFHESGTRECEARVNVVKGITGWENVTTRELDAPVQLLGLALDLGISHASAIHVRRSCRNRALGRGTEQFYKRRWRLLEHLIVSFVGNTLHHGPSTAALGHGAHGCTTDRPDLH